MLCFYLLICVQIVLESFPVSSSGHILLLEKILQWLSAKKIILSCLFDAHNAAIFMRAEIVEHFLHGATAVVIALFFFKRWSFFFTHLRACFFLGIKLILLVGLSDVMTSLFYFLFKVIDLSFFPVWIGFVFSSLALFSLVLRKDITYQTFTWKKALLIGLVQGIAFLPGVSRMGITFVVARWLKLSHKKAFEISFLVQWPLIMVAFLNSITFRKIYSDASMLPLLFGKPMIITIMCASVIAFLALWLVQILLYRKKSWIFSLYLVFPILLWLTV